MNACLYNSIKEQRKWYYSLSSRLFCYRVACISRCSSKLEVLLFVFQLFIFYQNRMGRFVRLITIVTIRYETFLIHNTLCTFFCTLYTSNFKFGLYKILRIPATNTYVLLSSCLSVCQSDVLPSVSVCLSQSIYISLFKILANTSCYIRQQML